MISETSDSAPELQKQHGEPAKDGVLTLVNKIIQLKEQIKAERIVSIKEKVQRNGDNLQGQVSAVMSAISLQAEEKMPSHMLSARIDHPLRKLGGFSQGSGDKNHIKHQDLSAISIKIPYMERLPRYTSWIHLARNEIMADDQSVVGKRRIYYDQHGDEALICTDSEEELTEPEEVKYDFSEGEDRLLLMAFEEHGLTEEVLNIVSQFVGGTSSEIQERFKNLKENNMGRMDQHSEDSGGCESRIGMCLEKSLSAALDSFDNLFCRRCILFDCPPHGCSQALIYPCEKLSPWSEPKSDSKPCSDQCYLQLKVVKNLPEDSTPGFPHRKTTKMEEADGILAPSSADDLGNQSTKDNMGKRKVRNQSDSAVCDSTLPPDDSHNCCKKLKKISDDIVTVSSDYNRDLNLDACDQARHTITSNKLIVSGSTCHDEHDKHVRGGQKDATNETEFKQRSNSMEGQVDELLNFSDWKPLEKELYLKGVEMFGKNSCLIARNLLSGLKTCTEVDKYMHAGGVSTPHRSTVASCPITDENGKVDAECKDQEMPSRTQLLRKRGKTRKFRYSWKSAGLPSIWRRISNGKNQSLKHYTPCECQGTCGKQCPCHDNGNCCEKYCGCSKFCKNRFRGCHCANSQCRSRQCPCFAANRECDPDVCRNCWVSCGKGSLGEPPQRGDAQCGNMRLLLRQKQRILLAKSDVAGWGAFLKSPVKKHDYLGEYTGELISQTEADMRGKIYDRVNSSFLFDLNDQYVIDAYRKGDKLKFANHSPNSNCYAKVIMVAGDHRVGIFAKENIEAGDELFYDYCYGPNQAQPWACKPESSKSEESAVSQGRARKH